MKIACIDCSLVPALESLGHECLRLSPPAGYVFLTPLLAQADFVPDLIIQQEVLGPRKILSDLQNQPCFKAFWSIDTHLNAFWHVEYGKLFDLVLTTQKDWVEKLKHQGLPHVEWLPWYGFAYPWSPWDARTHDVCFVGRVTAYRMGRKHLVDFLQKRYHAHIAQDVDFTAMKGLYADSRIAPNESILAEVNFRSFEAASCGAMVLNQRFDNGLDELFEPGREMDTFDHILELKPKTDFYLRHPALTRQLALAGRDRIEREHLPIHRATRMMELCQRAPRSAVYGPEASIAWIRTDLLVGKTTIVSSVLEEMLVALPCIPLGLTTLIQVVHCSHDWERMQALLIPLLQKGQYDHDLRVNLAASMAALASGEINIARQFLFRYVDTLPRRDLPGNATPLELCRCWSRILLRHECLCRPGFLFDAKKHLPETAIECLLLASVYDPENSTLITEISRLMKQQRGLEGELLKALSYVSLRDRDNWRLGCDLALTNFRVFRMQQGLEELTAAHNSAVNQGQEERFIRTLQRMDPTGEMVKGVNCNAQDTVRSGPSM